MGVEIERKFLVADESWREAVIEAGPMRQGYVSAGRESTVRVRIAGARAWLTIKGQARGLVRPEFEYDIPVEDAEQIFELLCEGRRLEKVRHLVNYKGHVWEIDVFEGENEGLTVAEIELDAAHESFERPPWLGREVTGDVRYYNARLVQHPFRAWTGER
ncbi:MAG: CYTH domain-containing protein [Bradymonadaceae bacterium]